MNHKNYNSSTSQAYSLHISNESTEMSLPPDALSSANNFDVNLSPPLDLNQLSFLKSTDVEVNMTICYLSTCFHPYPTKHPHYKPHTINPAL